VQQQKLLASDGEAADWFAWHVDVSGHTALIGSRLEDENGGNAGAVYAFDFNGLVWVETQKVLASDGAAGDCFGNRLAVTGDVAVIAAFTKDEIGEKSGCAYVLWREDGAWVERAKVRPADGAAFDRFGSTTAISGDVALVGAMDHNDGIGAAWLLHGLFDCNDNAEPDLCDVNDGIALDCNGNGTPDECEYPGCPGILAADMNCDGIANGDDIQHFIETLLSGEYTCQADIDQNGLVEIEDVPGFVAGLLTP
jgi:hypothetical protein